MPARRPITRCFLLNAAFFAASCGYVGFEPSTLQDLSTIAACENGHIDNNETGIDCGGSECPPCTTGIATSCEDLHTMLPTLKTAVYTLYVPDAATTEIYNTTCEMSQHDGGWTLALKIDGNKSTFDYENAIWTSAGTYQAEFAGIDTNEAKLLSFSSIPVKAMRLGMTVNNITHWIEIPVASNPTKTLRQIFQDGTHIATTAGRASWMSLIDNAKLQPYCDLEGFNVRSPTSSMPYARARIGIIGNENGVADCDSPDSYVGFGAGNPRGTCGSGGAFKAGTGNGWECDVNNGYAPTDTAAFGYVMVR